MTDIRYMSKADLDEVNRRAALWRQQSGVSCETTEPDTEQPSDVAPNRDHWNCFSEPGTALNCTYKTKAKVNREICQDSAGRCRSGTIKKREEQKKKKVSQPLIGDFTAPLARISASYSNSGSFREKKQQGRDKAVRTFSDLLGRIFSKRRILGRGGAQAETLTNISAYSRGL